MGLHGKHSLTGSHGDCRAGQVEKCGLATEHAQEEGVLRGAATAQSLQLGSSVRSSN